MKKSLLPLLSLALVLFAFNCTNEPLEGFDLDTIEGPTIPGNNLVTPVVGENVDVETSTGDYWPTQIGYSWDFDTTFFGSVTSEIVGTTIFDNQNFYEFDNFMGQSNFFVGKEGSNYYVAQNITGTNVNGYTLSAPVIVLLLLKDNLQVGETFTQNITYTISYTPDPGLPPFGDQTVTATYTTEMIERDITYQVGGVDYNDVLHIRLETSALGSTAVSDYYFAKDIGPIDFSQSTGQNAVLTSYQF